MNFQFEDLTGKKIAIDSIETPVLVKATASWCKPCLAEIPAINKIAEEYDGKFKVILLFWDEKETVAKMANRLVRRDHQTATSCKFYTALR